ncbi:MAG: DUF2382 domain-containing protein [Cyanobacteria bacterium P01_H01_bin.21]
MALFKIADRYPNYQNRFFDGQDIKGTSVYVSGNDTDKVGSVHDVLVDEAGRMRYLVIDTGFWIFGKQILLPIGRCVDDPERDRIYVQNLTKPQVEQLPKYSSNMVVDSDYEEQVRSVYRATSVETTAPVEMSVPVERSGRYATVDQVYSYDKEPLLYGMDDNHHKRLRLYEERLVTDKKRQKTGSVTVSKRIETEVNTAEVPVQKEKVVIEIESVKGGTRVNMPDDSFQDGEVTRLDIHEEQADIRKEPVVYQEVNIRKETETDVVTARERLRREELQVHKQGNPPVVNEDRQIDM